MTKIRLAPLAREHPENQGVLAYLSRDAAGREPIARPSSVSDPQQGGGSHPDVVEWLRGTLGRDLPRAAHALVFGKPALVHERAGLVLAAALGTQYALRLPAARWPEAERAGMATSHRYRTAGVTLDLAAFGPAWRFGAWSAREPEWLLEEHARLALG